VGTSNTLQVASGATITAANLYLNTPNASSGLNGYYNQTGGSVTLSGDFGLGNYNGNGGNACPTNAIISGGTLTANGQLYLYKWSTSNLTVSNAGVANAATLRLGWVDSSPTGTINLGDGTTFSGGMVFTGTGTTTLTGAVSFTGPTKVAAGTLAGTTTLGNLSVAHLAALEGGSAGAGTLTAAEVTLGSLATDATALKGKLAAIAGYKPLAVTNLTLNGGNGTVALAVSGTGLTNGNTYDLLVSTNPITAPNATSVLAALKSGARAFTPAVSGDFKIIQVLYMRLRNSERYFCGSVSGFFKYVSSRNLRR